MTGEIVLPIERSPTRPLVGRERELTEILACLDRAAEGRGSLVFVMGAPGIGKSRLVDEAAMVAMTHGTPVLWGRCWDTAGAPPYWPWVQAMRAYLRSAGPSEVRAQLGPGAADVAQMLPELGEMVPDLAPPPATDPESARFQLFDSITTFLLNVSRGRGLVVVIDDVHAADLASILLLRFVGKQVREGPLVVIATYRDVELTPDHPLSAALPDLAREPSTLFVELLGLTEASTRTLAEESAGFEPRPALIKALHRSTGGNPLFIRETIRLLVSEGRLSAESGSESLSVAVVPARVHEVIARRLTHVSEPARDLLVLAAVIGPEFSIDAIRAVIGLADDDVLDRLDEAVEAGLLAGVPGPPGRFRFSHELIRETLYADVTPASRARLHRRAALALEELYGSDLDAHLAELAHHFFEAEAAGDQLRAEEYATRAGQQAAGLLAYEEAARLFGMALAAQEAHGPGDRTAHGELLLALGDAQDRSGDWRAAQGTFLRAVEVARRNGATAQMARAALGYGGRNVWKRAGRDLRLVPLLRDALVLLGGQDDHLRVRLLSRLAGALRSERDREQNDALSQQAVELASSLNDPATLAYALEGRFWAIWWPENPELRLSISYQLRSAAQAAEDSERLASSHVVAFGVLCELGRLAEARAEADAIARVVEELRQPAQRWLPRAGRALLLLHRGNFDEAEGLIAHSLEVASVELEETSAARSQLFLLRREQNRLAELEEGVRSTIGAFPWYPLHLAELALLLAETGRRGEAQARFDDLARDRFAIFHRDCEWLLGMAIASEVCAMLGDLPAAEILYEELDPFAGFHAVGQAEGSVGAVDRYLGLLAETLGREADAVRHLEDAERLNERMGARPWTLRSQADLARVLRHANEAPDQARAAGLERSARAGATELGMVALLAQLEREAGQEPPVREAPTAQMENTFRREGDYWLVEFDGTSVRVRDTKGMRYLARLLADPGRELHVLDLAGARAAGDGKAAEPDLASDGLGDAGARLDPQAKAEYRRRVEDLRADIAEAEAWNDPERAARGREELVFVTHELAGAVGLGGRDRKAASASERARLSVTRAIRSAMDRLRDLDPSLGAHLDATVRTGTYCAYTPDPRVPVRWEV